MQKQFITDKINIEKYFEMLEIPSDIVFSDNPISKDLYSEIEFKNVKLPNTIIELHCNNNK